MNAQSVASGTNQYARPATTNGRSLHTLGAFQTVLNGSLSSGQPTGAAAPSTSVLPKDTAEAALASPVVGGQFLVAPAVKISMAAYGQFSVPSSAPVSAPVANQSPVAGPDPARQTGWQKYKDDQLLRNPGGDYYHLDQKRVSVNPRERESFVARVGKNLADVAGNIKNFFKNMFMGSTVQYRDENNQIQEAGQRGLVGTVVNAVKNIGSALTFGLWHPDSAQGPQGVTERLAHVGRKLKQALFGDLLAGIPQSLNHMGKNLVLAGLNLVQVVPDATIGNFDAGRKLTTTVFDNGQVLVEYLTDVIPSGDAWFRVHASKLGDGGLPVLYNLQVPEYAKDDPRWQYVRNTPFRKTIETVGSLLADIATLGLVGQTVLAGDRHGDQRQLLP
jgi:hypothetical protein